MCVGMPGYKCVSGETLVGTQQVLHNIDKFLGLGIFAVPVIIAIVSIILKKSVSFIVKTTLIILAVLIILKYPFLGILKNYL